MDTPLRVVLVGCGGISRTWLKSAIEIPGIEIVGLVDILAENARQRAEQFVLPDAEIDSDLSRMLDRVCPDVVFDCTVPEAHVEVTLEALAHGCHVLGEKPMTDSLANAQRMLGVAQAVGKQYAVMQNRRYQAEIRAAKAFLDSGQIGALTTLNSDFFLAPHFGGFREQMRHVLLLDMTIHTFDQARFLIGADPVSVFCKEWNPSGSWFSHGASAVAIFEFSNGVVYTYRGSWCAEGMSTSWDSDWRLIGERGTILWDGAENLSAEFVTSGEGTSSTRTKAVIAPYEGPKTGGHAGLIRDFVDCLRTGRTPETTCTDNIHSLAMVFGAIRSADEGVPVSIKIE